MRRCPIIHTTRKERTPWSRSPRAGRALSVTRETWSGTLSARVAISIVIGAQQDVLAKHRKEYSLDYWLRVNCTERRDTMQATGELVDRLVGTELLYRDKVIDPQTGQLVNGLRLSSAG